MNYTAKMIEIKDVKETVDLLNGMEEFTSLGLPYEARVVNNWELGAPEDEYPELIVNIPNYTNEEIEADEEGNLMIQAMFGMLPFGLSGDIGDNIIIVDTTIEGKDYTKLLLQTDQEDKDISGYFIEGGGKKFVPLRNDEPEITEQVNAIINDIIANNQELLEGYKSFF